MKFFSKNGYIVFISLFFITIFFVNCVTRPPVEKDVFGIYDNYTLKNSDLSLQEKASIVNVQKQLFETAQRILENHYLDYWFVDYQVKNKFLTLQEAKKDYFLKNISVSSNEIDKFLKENANNKELLKIPESERAATVQQYLTRVAQTKIEQKILKEAYSQQKIKLIAYQEPVEPIIQFEETGHIYNTNLTNAPITLIEFADYQCPFCVKANEEIMKIVSEYEGKVQYIFRDFPLLDKHPQALPAALAAKCAENQGKYWEMHKLIFNRAPLDELNMNKYLSYAEKLNLNLTEFKECQADPTQKETIETDLSEGLRIGVNETPTIYINGKKFDGYITYENLKNEIEERLKK